MLIAAEVNCVIHDSWCAKKGFRNHISGYNLKFFAWINHEYCAAFGRNDDPVADGDRCGVLFAAAEVFLIIN